MATVHEMAVLARCTRDGRILWGHVAKQLGRSEHDTRSQLDPHYLREPQEPQEPQARAAPRMIRERPPVVRRPLYSRKVASVIALADLAQPALTADIAGAMRKTAKAAADGLRRARQSGLIESFKLANRDYHTLTPVGRAFVTTTKREAGQ